MSTKEKRKILVVDDERSNIDALSYILKPRYTVLVAKDGLTAIEVAKSRSPDLILLDIVMPGMNGFEVLSALKESDETRPIPVIFITGRDSFKDEEKGFALGAVDYVTKPFHNSIVEARVKTHIQMIEYIQMIEHLCMIDALTNIPNRRHFDNRLSTEWEKAFREKTPVGMLMIDVDRFKDYNDTYGHLQGDKLLQAIVGIITQALKRPTDFAARWGGEEFAVLLPDTDSDGAFMVAERIREDIQRAVIPCSDGTGTRITVSIGVDSEIPASGDASGSLIYGADEALYAAKEAGRNIVMRYRKS